jgi:uncharacterized protein (TIGR03083 family)
MILSGVRPPAPVSTADLFPEVHEALIALLADLPPAAWLRPTACAGWNVHDVALHLLGGQIGNLSRRRDGFSGLTPAAGEGIATFVNRINDEWMRAGRRISPAVLCDLMAATGPRVAAYFAGLDPLAIGGPVSWAGPEPAPVWLDVAREYTEWWHHQQHIRDAVGRPGLTGPRYLGPAIATFVHALPQAFREVEDEDETLVMLTVDGDAGGDWGIIREGGRWRLFEGWESMPNAHVTLEADLVWRLFTREIAPERAWELARKEGSPHLLWALLRAVAII